MILLLAIGRCKIEYLFHGISRLEKCCVCFELEEKVLSVLQFKLFFFKCNIVTKKIKIVRIEYIGHVRSEC